MASYVFSVGGARGVLQAAAAAHLIRDAPKEWQPTSCYGNSVGALNAAMVATGQVGRLSTIWENITNRKVYKRKFSVARALTAAVTGKPMLDTTPLLDMIYKELKGVIAEMPFSVQYVTTRGKLETVTVEAGQDVKDMHVRAIYNSCVIPFAMDVKFGGYDGGIFNPIPLDLAIDREADRSRMVVLSAHPLEGQSMTDTPKRSTGHAVRAVGLLQRGLIYQNVQTFERINAATEGSGLSGLKHFDAMTIAPDTGTWWGMLDFDKASDTVIWNYGMNLARRALELKTATA